MAALSTFGAEAAEEGADVEGAEAVLVLIGAVVEAVVVAGVRLGVTNGRGITALDRLLSVTGLLLGTETDAEAETEADGAGAEAEAEAEARAGTGAGA
jgi:hypothetical protein